MTFAICKSCTLKQAGSYLKYPCFEHKNYSRQSNMLNLEG